MVTVIVPVYNEEQRIPLIEQELAQLRGGYEVIFSDGFSTDASFDLITHRKIREARFRSNQMNAAARYARGEYLWFVHADSVLHPDSIAAIEASQAENGCFTLHFDTAAPVMRCIASCASWRVRIRNIAFGDQGIFIKRALFERIGGYRSIQLMEDYQLSIDLKKQGYRFCLLPLPIITSARRFEKKGALPTLIEMQRLQYRFRHGADCAELNREYAGLSK